MFERRKPGRTAYGWIATTGARLDATGSGSTELALSRGLHAMRLLYTHEAGPAFLFLAWDRPAFFELLPVEHYMVDRDDRIASLRFKEIEAALCMGISVLTVGFSVEGLEIRLAQPCHNLAIELALERHNRYQILYFLGDRGLATQAVDRADDTDDVFFVATLAVPEAARTSGYDRIQILPIDQERYNRLGRFLLH